MPRETGRTSKLASSHCDRHKVIDQPFSDESINDDLVNCEEGITDAVIHYTFWPQLLDKLRARTPGIGIHVRSHNAEALQHLHRSGLDIATKSIRVLYGAANLFRADMRCRQLADTVVTISAWEERNYWRFVPGSARVVYGPYHSPWYQLRRGVVPAPWAERDNRVICLAGGRDRLGSSQRDNFIRLAGLAGRRGHESWEFAITAGSNGKGTMSPLVRT